MELFRHSEKDDITATQNDLCADFTIFDTWGKIEVAAPADEAERLFVAAICSEAAADEQKKMERLAEMYPNDYDKVTIAGAGKTEYAVFKTADGCKILFVSDYAQKALKKVITKKSMGTTMKIHTAKVRNRFDPTGWRRTSWYFVAYALITGDEDTFPRLSYRQ